MPDYPVARQVTPQFCVLKRVMQGVGSTVPMAKNEKRDLLIHFDEEGQQVIFYAAPLEATSAIRAKGFDGVRPEVQFFREKEPDEAERAMGEMVFSAIDLFALKKNWNS